MTALFKARFRSSAAMTLALACGIMLAAAPQAQAEPIPQESLQAQQDACMKSCGTTKAGDAVCTSYCGCFRQQVSNTMSMEDLMELEQAMKDGKPLPEDPNEKMQSAIKTCTERAKQ
jgi:hypothetical protein